MVLIFLASSILILWLRRGILLLEVDLMHMGGGLLDACSAALGIQREDQLGMDCDDCCLYVLIISPVE